MIGRVVWVDYTTHEQKGVLVRLSVRMEDGSKRNIYVEGTEPYIFAPEEETVPVRDYIKKTESGYESLFDEPLQKIVTETPKQAGNLTDNFSWTGEADVPYYRRVSIHDSLSGYIDIPENGDFIHIDDIDTNVEYSDVIEPRISIADIEVQVPTDGTFSEMQEKANQPINVICSYDTVKEDYSVFYYDKYDNLKTSEIRPQMEAQLEDTGIEEYGEAEIELVVCETETDLLNSFIDYTEERGFDLLSGWNFTDFDYQYIIDRINTLSDNGEKVYSSWLSPFDRCGYASNPMMQVRGLPSFDMMQAFCDKLTFSNWRSKSLEYVANEELGIGKIADVNINKDWKNCPSRLIAYNIVDVILTVALDDVNDIHNFFYDMTDACSIPVYDGFYEKRLVDGYVMSRRSDKEVLPTADESELIDNAGGYVDDPANGRLQNVGVADLKSLYPSAMITWNISTETVAETPENFENYVKIPKVPEPKEVDGNISEHLIDMDWLYASLDKQGLIPRTLKKLFKKRNREKELMYEAEDGSPEQSKWDRKQGATKVIMNSFYGNASSKYWRLSNKYLGDAVTSTARYTLWKGRKTIERLGYEAVYGDSVTPNRTVIVKNTSEEIRVIRFDELWKKATDKSISEKESGKLVGWKALSYNENGESEWKNINKIIRHETDKDIVELQQARGSSITTKDHSFVVEENGKLVEKKPQEVKRPLRVDVPNEEIKKKNCNIDLYSIVDGYEREYLEKRGAPKNPTEKIKKVRKSGKKLYYGIPGSDDYKRAVFVDRFIDSEEKLNALLRLCAAYISDGSSSTDETFDGGWGASICNSDISWLEQLQKDYNILFEAKASIIESDVKDKRKVDGYEYNDDTYKLQMMNEISAVVFASLCGQTSSAKEIPDFLYNLPSKYKKLFINNVVKGDGSRSFPRYRNSYPENNFEYTTISSKLASGLSVLLNQLDVKHNFSYREEKGSYNIRTVERYDSRDNQPTIIEREGYDYVYDLSVEDNNNFVDGMGQILLHNTDSHFIQLTRDTIEGQVDELEEISEEMDKDASQIADDIGIEGKHPFLIDSDLHGDEYTCMMWEPEKIYSVWMQLGNKKRYAGNIDWKEGTFYSDSKISISGFENQRSDSPEVTAELQHNIIEMVLTGEDFVTVSDYIQSIIDEIDTNNPDVKKFALPGSINKPLHEYPNREVPRACMWSNSHLDKRFSEDDDPFVYYVKDTPSDLPRTDVIALEWDEEMPDGFELDKEAIVERAIRKPIQPIIDEMDWRFNELRTGKRQMEKDLSTGGSNPFT